LSVAKIRTYNPPPNWPPPPPGWTPPPGWEPDPAWGPPPEAWPVFIESRANASWSCLGSLGAAAVLLVVFIAIGTIVARSAPSPEAFGEILGRCLLAAVVTTVIAYFWTKRWHWWTYLLVAFGVYAVASVLTTVGQQAAAGG
jgi:hypothetical protein